MEINSLLTQLIGINSISGNEGEIQKYIFNYLEDLGVNPFWQGKNVVAKFPGSKNQALIFNAHVDTVSIGDISQWEKDPFSGFSSGEKIYGLGASDEKAGVAGLLLLAKLLKNKQLSPDIWLTFVTDEETTGEGTKSFFDWLEKNQYLKKYSKIFGILTEPTNLTSFEFGHRGNIFVKLTTLGNSGHGSKPEKIKKHAVLQMLHAINKIQDLEKIWKEKYSHPSLGAPSIGIGTSIQGGDINSPNKFPDKCIATLDIRTTPSLHSKCLKELKNFLRGDQIKVEYLYNPLSFGFTREDSQIIKKFKTAFPKLKLERSPGATDQCFFTEKEIDAIVFGPGERDIMHQPNEYCYPEKIEQWVEMIEKILEAW